MSVIQAVFTAITITAGCTVNGSKPLHHQCVRYIKLAKTFVDYCGPTVGVTDPETGEIRTAQVIVAVLGASSYTWAEATVSAA
ncbi:hypothetical protein ECZU51_49320 [Escherichia coli]|nr:hypothetical protein ECZU51_49320 [Escherichia coli]